MSKPFYDNWGKYFNSCTDEILADDDVEPYMSFYNSRRFKNHLGDKWIPLFFKLLDLV